MPNVILIIVVVMVTICFIILLLLYISIIERLNGFKASNIKIKRLKTGGISVSYL